MRVHAPHDLPDFRMWLIDQWRPGGLYSHLARAHDLTGGIEIRDGVPVVRVDAKVPRHSLPKAALWWVSEDMAALIDHAADTLPPTTLTEDLMPDDDGLVVFARPLTGIDADIGTPIQVNALTWSSGKIQSRRSQWVDGIAIGTYRYVLGTEAGSLDTGVTINGAAPEPGAEVEVGGQRAIAVGRVPEDFWIPLGASDWLLGADTEEPVPGFAGDRDERLASMSEDRRWLAALWLLASQPLAESVTTRAPRATVRRSQRRRLGSDVRLVNLRRAATPHEPAEHGERRGYSHRFIVEGFWRQQACGPGWSQHRPTYIAPFVKGPADKPLIVKETVKVVR
jgi:hypothetical protein